MSFLISPPSILANPTTIGATTLEHKGLTSTTGFLISSTSGFQFVRAYSFVDVNNSASVGDCGRSELGLSLGSTRPLMWSSTSVANSLSADVYLYRDSAAILAQRNGTNAQTFKVYGTTDSGLTNYERLAISAQQGVGFTIGAETLGTGADNLDITIAPAGTGKVAFPSGASARSDGYFTANGMLNGTESSVNFYAIGFRTKNTGEYAWTSGAVAAAADTAFHRDSAGVAAIDNGTVGAYRDLIMRNARLPAVAFASLVAAATAGAGARSTINNCSTAVFNAAADGAGALTVPVWSDGAAWKVG